MYSDQKVTCLITTLASSIINVPVAEPYHLVIHELEPVHLDPLASPQDSRIDD